MDVGQRVAIVGIVVSGLLAILKVIVGWMAGSTAVVADGVESAGDVFASGFVWLGLWLASKPADANHPYGHGRLETLTGLLVGLALVLVGAGISANALRAVGELHPPPARYAIWPLFISIGAKSFLSGLKFHFGKKIRSAALTADAWNDSVDILSAVVALAAVSLTLYDPSRFLAADHYGGFAVGLIVVFTGLRVARDAALILIDTMPGEELMNEIRQVAISIDGVHGVEKCFARRTGFQYHVDLHLEVNPDMTVRASHDIATDVKNRIKADLKWVADVLVHVEPAPEETISDAAGGAPGPRR